MTIREVPRHIGFVPDGNRRWAKIHHTSRIKAYEIGGQKFEDILDWSMEAGVKQVSAFILSMENVTFRGSLELKEIFMVISDLMERWLKPGSIIDRYKVKVNFVGEIDLLPSKLRGLISKMLEKTKTYRARLINIAIAYSGKNEIAGALKRIVLKVMNGSKISLTPKTIQKELGVEQPIDLVIRTGGFNRLSGFMIWQASYAEIYSTKVKWPDFDRKEFKKALAWYSRTKRNFGR